MALVAIPVPKSAGFEKVVRFTDDRSGLVAYVAIHDTSRGPALGGCRVRHYADEDAAKLDAMKLAEAMTWKAAVAGVPFGGGKMVVKGPTEDRRTLHRFVAACVDHLAGTYYTAEDMGFSRNDVAEVAKLTEYVAWRDGMGDPSRSTALGVLLAMDACRAHVWRDRPWSDITVHVQGIGAVGRPLAEALIHMGATVSFSEVDAGRAKDFASRTGATLVSPARVPSVECDIFAPCGAGGTIDYTFVTKTPAQVICGAANNQLATPDVARKLHARGILYAPDFVANAGGLVHAWYEFDKSVPIPDTVELVATLMRIPENLRAIIAESEERDVPTAGVALDRARRIVEDARKSAPKKAEGRIRIVGGTEA